MHQDICLLVGNVTKIPNSFEIKFYQSLCHGILCKNQCKYHRTHVPQTVHNSKHVFIKVQHYKLWQTNLEQ